MDYLALFAALNRAGIRYLVTGGVAVNLHGVPRMTFDVDLAVEFGPENLDRLEALLDEMGYAPRVPMRLADLADPEKRTRLAEEENMLAMSFRRLSAPLGEIDILLAPGREFADLESGREVVSAGEVDIPVVSLDDMIAMKDAARREQDAADAAALRRIKEEGRG